MNSTATGLSARPGSSSAGRTTGSRPRCSTRGAEMNDASAGIRIRGVGARQRGRRRAAVGLERCARLVRRRCSPPACASRGAMTCACATPSSAARRSSPTRPRSARRRSGMPQPPSPSRTGPRRSSTGTMTPPPAERSARGTRRCAGRVRAPARRGRRLDRSRPAAPPHGRRVRRRAHRRGAARRRSAVGCRRPRPDPDRDAGRAPARAAAPGEARGRRRSRARGARRSRREPRLSAEAAAGTAPRGRAGRVDEPMGARRAAASRHRAAARVQEALAAAVGERLDAGSRSGCTTAGSGPSTCRAESSRGAGRRRAEARSSCRASCARRCGRIRGGGWSSRTWRSSNPGCSRRWPATRRWRMPPAAATSTPASSTAVRSRPSGGEDRDPRGDVRRDDGRVGPARSAPAPDLSPRDGPRRRGGAHRRGRRARLDLARAHVAAAVGGLGRRPVPRDRGRGIRGG